VRHPYKIIKGDEGEMYHLAAIEIAILIWERAGYTIKSLPLIYVTDQRAGYMKFLNGTIQVPRWIFSRAEKDINYAVYYIAHELAHFHNWMNGIHEHHGQTFMLAFRELCPEECQGYEHDYKPRAAKTAGVGKRTR
jgi:hypothetical protein